MKNETSCGGLALLLSTFTQKPKGHVNLYKTSPNIGICSTKVLGVNCFTFANVFV